MSVYLEQKLDDELIDIIEKIYYAYNCTKINDIDKLIEKFCDVVENITDELSENKQEDKLLKFKKKGQERIIEIYNLLISNKIHEDKKTNKSEKYYDNAENKTIKYYDNAENKTIKLYLINIIKMFGELLSNKYDNSYLAELIKKYQEN